MLSIPRQRQVAVMQHQYGGAISPAPPPDPRDLDDYTADLKIAGGFHQLLSSYSGSLIRVERTDTTQQDIGFGANGELNETALLGFVGTGAGNHGAVVAIYNQVSGFPGQWNSTGTGARIVEDGVIQRINGRPSPKVVTQATGTFRYHHDPTVAFGVGWSFVFAGTPINASANRLVGTNTDGSSDFSGVGNWIPIYRSAATTDVSWFNGVSASQTVGDDVFDVRGRTIIGNGENVDITYYSAEQGGSEQTAVKAAYSPRGADNFTWYSGLSGTDTPAYFVGVGSYYGWIAAWDGDISGGDLKTLCDDTYTNWPV